MLFRSWCGESPSSARQYAAPAHRRHRAGEAGCSSWLGAFVQIEKKLPGQASRRHFIEPGQSTPFAFTLKRARADALGSPSRFRAWPQDEALRPGGASRPSRLERRQASKNARQHQNRSKFKPRKMPLAPIPLGPTAMESGANTYALPELPPLQS